MTTTTTKAMTGGRGRRALLVGVLAGLTAAGPAAAAPPVPAPAPAEGMLTGQLVVFAAASLKEVFEQLARDLMASHPGLKVVLNFAGSQELRTQIEQGARADLFASADLKPMVALQAAGLARPSRVFARNELVLIVPASNPAKIEAFDQLRRPHRLVVGAPEVPVGKYTEQVLAGAGKRLGLAWQQAVQGNVVSRELNVRQVLAKVTLGEADAGIVYRTDARAAGGRVKALAIPADLNVLAEYPVAALSGARADLAAAWQALLLSPAGQQRLAAAGFLPPGRSVASAPRPGQ